MSRSAKRFKNDTKIPIHSGNFMLSNTYEFNDDEEDTKEMPVASPDTTYNEAPVEPVDELKPTNNSKTLKNLIHYIKSNYSPNLNTPKWKNFNGLKLQAKDKVRLNNVIWRTWFQQYGIKDATKRKKPAICQFFSNQFPFDESLINKTHNVLLEGKYWKRKLESITTEYKKWREFSRKKIKLPMFGNDTDAYFPTSSHTPVKQTFSNRCPSPSPRLFQELEFQNMNQDSCFFLEDDPRDPIFGTNADLFQPDLMRLFPSFDFLDFDDLNAGISPPEADVTQTYQQNNNNSNALYNPSMNYSINITNNSNTIIRSADTLSTNNNNTNFGLQQQQQQQQQSQPMEYTELSTFNTLNTLATVAAQSPHLNNQEIQYTAANNTQTKVDTTQSIKQQQQQMNFNTYPIHNNNNNNNSMLGQNRSTPVNTNSTNNTIRNLLAQQPMKLSNAGNQMQFSNHTNSINNQQAAPTGTPVSQQQQQPMLNLPRKQSSRITNNNTFNSQQQLRQQQLSNTTPTTIDINPLPPSIVTSTTAGAATMTTSAHQHLQNTLQQLNQADASSILYSLNNNSSDTNNAIVSALLNQLKSGNTNFTFTQNTDTAVSATPPPPPPPPVAPTKGKGGRKPASDKLANNFKQQPQSNSILNSNTGLGSLSTSSLKLSNSTQSLNINTDLNSYSFNNSLSHHLNTTPTPSAHRRLSTSFLSNYQQNTSMNNNNNNNMSDSNSPISPNSSNSGYNNDNKLNSDYFTKSSPSSFVKHQQKIDRSDSLNSNLNDTASSLNQPCSNAEQKRRCNIQYGFERLQQIVPSLRETKNGKASKAAMLQKTAEYIHQLKANQAEKNKDLQAYKNEIESLSDQISDLQNELPENGVSMLGGGNVNRKDKFRQKFSAYVQERTVENWKFYLFSMIMKPLFETYVENVNTSSRDDLEQSVVDWQSRYCNLGTLRPSVTGALRQLSKSTSILSDPSKLPEECYNSAISKL